MWVSWAWKGTLIGNLKRQKDLELTFIKSYVTRPMRKWEIEGNIYNFVSLEEFKRGVDFWEFLEYELNHWLHYYWTKHLDVVENWINKWKNVLKEIDIKWLKNIFKNNPKLKAHVTSIFLDISEETLVERIKKRWADMSDVELQNRRDSLKLEKKDSKIYCDYIIDTSNNTKEQTLEAVLEIIKKEWKYI
jgi:guanylate kinase